MAKRGVRSTSKRAVGSAQTEADPMLEPADIIVEPPHWQPTEEEVRLRAYQRYLERGAAHGGDVDDWIEAERELRIARQS
jgi:Protein of unknown function (DUF2934)